MKMLQIEDGMGRGGGRVGAHVSVSVPSPDRVRQAISRLDDSLDHRCDLVAITCQIPSEYHDWCLRPTQTFTSDLFVATVAVRPHPIVAQHAL